MGVQAGRHIGEGFRHQHVQQPVEVREQEPEDEVERYGALDAVPSHPPGPECREADDPAQHR
jgi:hypothetical protein